MRKVNKNIVKMSQDTYNAHLNEVSELRTIIGGLSSVNYEIALDDNKDGVVSSVVTDQMNKIESLNKRLSELLFKTRNAQIVEYPKKENCINTGDKLLLELSRDGKFDDVIPVILTDMDNISDDFIVIKSDSPIYQALLNKNYNEELGYSVTDPYTRETSRFEITVLQYNGEKVNDISKIYTK